MKIEQASKILNQMHQGALPNERALSFHLFAIKYADDIRNMSAKDIAIGAGLAESYKTDIRKGVNLAKYVKVRK